MSATPNMSGSARLRWPGLGLLAALTLVTATAWYWGTRPPPQRRNVILISIDTLRGDHLGYAGYKRPTSPAVDRLAGESVAFTNAFSQAPSTLPSHASMFTSLYPSVHRADPLTATPLAGRFVTLAELFRKNGFRTAAFVEGGQLAAVWNLTQGFDLYDVTEIKYGNDQWRADDVKGILAKAAHWIEDHRHEPFFCFIHSYVVHAPYSPRPPYDRMFDEGYDGPLPFHIEPEVCERLSETWRTPDDPDVRHLASLYDGEIRYMNEYLGRFLDRMRASGIADESVIVFTSDHGEEFGEHGRVGLHGYNLYDEVLHVPLLMRVPGMAPRRIDRQVRLIDLPPTLLGLMHIDPGDAPFLGQDLFATAADDSADLPVVSEMLEPEVGPWASLRADGHKIVGIMGTRFELFDMRSDPGEQTNLIGRDAEQDHYWIQRLWDIVQANRTLAANWHTTPVQLDAEVKKQLQALGYLRQDDAGGK